MLTPTLKQPITYIISLISLSLLMSATIELAEAIFLPSDDVAYKCNLTTPSVTMDVNTPALSQIGIGTKWTYSSFDLFPTAGSSLTDDIMITGEETIDGLSYWVLSPLSSCGPTATHLRIENQKYYLRINDEEYLMQDFSLQVGDSYTIPSFFESEDSLTIIIDSIGTTEIDGFSLRTQYCSYADEDNNQWEWQLVFVEHVGPLGYLVPQYGTCDPGVGNLRCISYEGGTLLNFTSSGECEDYLGYPYMRKGSRWYYGDWSLTNTTEVSEIVIRKDTISASGPRATLELLADDGSTVAGSQIQLYSYDNRVFFEINEAFKLLFDFSSELNLGDTVTYHLPPNANMYDNSSNGGMKEIINPYQYVIEDMDTVQEDSGRELRRWYVRDIPKEIDGQLYGNDLRVLVEGIGGTTCFMRRGISQLTAGTPEAFRCYSSSLINYTEVEDGMCDIVNTVDLSVEYDFVIAPNPSSEVIEIKTDFAYNRIIIYDGMGRPVLQHIGLPTIEVSALPLGIYTLVARSKEGSITTTFIKS